jgi:hypothetical protein
MPCAICGELKVDAHHLDYSQPFDVIFLCHPHHIKMHTKGRKEAKREIVQFQNQ